MLIARRTITVAGHELMAGDLAPLESYGCTDRLIGLLKEQRRVETLTPDSYARAMRCRAPGTVGKGFTAVQLIELGIIDHEPTAETPLPDANDPPEGTVEYRGAWLVPFASGIAKRWEVWTTRGQRLVETRFKNQAGAERYVDVLRSAAEAAASEQAQAAA